MKNSCNSEAAEVTERVAAASNGAHIKVPLTPGNLRNGHVYIRDFLWFFPKQAVRRHASAEPGDVITLQIPGVGPVETDIDEAKGIFRWRGWKRFFAQHTLAAGDCLIFQRTARGQYGVRIEPTVLDGLKTSDSACTAAPASQELQRVRARCNDLSGDEWLRYSISVWSDIRKTPEELALSHPAMFPAMLCERLLLMFLRRRGKHIVLDPFAGSGSTLVAACNLGKTAVGFDTNPAYVGLAKQRLDVPSLFTRDTPAYQLHCADARKLDEFLRPSTVDICITSPPYWDILNQRRTADNRETRHYGNLEADLGTIADYKAFLAELTNLFEKVYACLRPRAYCIVVVMDLRKKNRFYPFHSDLSTSLGSIGFVLDDIIIWDRGQEYNNLRPLGYPSVFRVNKVHEFILIFQKPA